MIMLAALLFVVSSPEATKCSLFQPVAPDEASARRVAEAVIKNVPPSERSRATKADGELYELVVEADPDNPNQWVAFERLPSQQGPAGEVILRVDSGGLSLRIDRCTGAIKRMNYQR